MFFRLDIQEAREVKFVLQRFLHSLDANIHDIEDINEKHDGLKVKNEKASESGKVKFRRPLTEGLLKRQILTFMKLLPVYLVLIVWTLSYFVIARNILTNIKQQQSQIRNSLTTLYTQNLLITEFIELICTNSAATVRGGPIEDDLQKNLKSLQNIGDIINQFRDSDGELTLKEQAVFFGLPCQDFREYSEFEALVQAGISSCIALSHGTGEISLTEITTRLY